MSRRFSWATGAAALAASAAAIGVLFTSDDPPPSARPASEREGPRAPRVALDPPVAREADPAPAPSGRDDAVAATSADVEAPSSVVAALTDDEVRARLAAGEPGMEVLASRLPESSRTTPLAPRWRAGDEWLVETWYRQVQAPEQGWSGPALWRFRVEREVSFRDEPCWELVVTRADEPRVEPVTLWITRAGRLAGVEATVVQQGKAVRSLHTPGDGAAALRAPATSAPLRLPPFGAEARVAPPGLPFDRLPAATPPDAPAPDELVGAGGDHLDIEFEDPVDGTRIRQRWSPGDLRWPVVSRTETTFSVRRS